MPLLVPQLPSEFVISIFGVQYHGAEVDASKLQMVQTLEALIDAGATFVEKMDHDDSERGRGTSRIFVSYWKSPEQFQTWWTAKDTAAFWKSLPDDAGVFRETMKLLRTRFVTEQSQETPAGSGHLGPLVPLTEKTGYWGALRDRIEESTTTDKLLSSLPQVPAMPASLQQAVAAGALHRGRVTISEFPRNLCFVLEGQERSGFVGDSDEGRLWSSKFHYNTNRFITNVLRGGADAGLLHARLCHAPASGLTQVNAADFPDDKEIFPALSYNRTAELFFFLDFHYMERVGRREKSHVALRRDFMEFYGPGCPMGHGNMFVWVDCGIIKPGDLIAEYIGCYEGTGFLPYRDHPAFKSVPTTTMGKAWSAVSSYVPFVN